MKRIVISLFLLLLLWSCDKSEYAILLEELPFYTAQTEQMDSIATKSYGEIYLNSSNDLKLRVKWHNNDRLSIFQNNTFNSEYKYVGETGTTSGKFVATDFFGTGEDQEITTLGGPTYALYPYYESTTIDPTNKTITVDIPNIQQYAENSFGKGSNLSIAVTQGEEDNVLFFKNTCTWFVFYIYGNTTISKIEFVGKNGEKLAGPARITASNGSIPTIEMLSDNPVNLVMDCGVGGVSLGNTEETATEFWFTLPPTTFDNGFDVKATDVNGITRTIYSHSSSISFKRNIFKRLTSKKLEFNVTQEEINAIAHAKEKSALTALYNATNGDSWTNKENWRSDKPVGEWYGITTDTDGRVVDIDLSNNNLSGYIPDEIGEFSRLTRLNLNKAEDTDGAIGGPLPNSICNLTSLKYLYISNHNIEGEIPENIGNLTNLISLHLTGNKLTGSIPESIWTDLTLLDHLLLDNNELTGGPSANIEKAVSLTELYLGFNKFNTSLPAEICNLTNLEILNIHNSGLSGKIPDNIGNMKALISLECGDNNLYGEIPESIGDLINLTHLSFGSNYLKGGIPRTIGNLKNLKTLCLDINGLDGNIPIEIENLTQLTELKLHTNRLSYCEPDLSKLTELVSLELQNNMLCGNILDKVTSCTKLKLLDLSVNKIEGEIPGDLCNLTDLEVLNLHDNLLTGVIPQNIGNLTALTCLNLGGNQLSGEIPASIGNLKKVTYLAIGNQNLTGRIPNEILGLESIEKLYLDTNDLCEAIPNFSELKTIKILSIANNPNLTGSLPLDFVNRLNIDLSNTQITTTNIEDGSGEEM